jgi:hypothetical protein
MQIVTNSQDKRGEVIVVEDEGKEYMFFKTLAGCCRGGDIHEKAQINIVIKGSVVFHCMKDGKEYLYPLDESGWIRIEGGVAHMMESTTDSLVMEFHEYPKTRTIFEPYRKIIEGQINEK